MGDMAREENKREFLREQQMILSETDPILNCYHLLCIFWGSV